MRIIEQAKGCIRPFLEPLSDIARINQEKVLKGFHVARVGTHCFGDSTGYGYHDAGREALEEIYAWVFRTEAALVRPQIVSGTHAINLGLSILRPNEELVSLSGAPYDTLQQVIGTKGSSARSLIAQGVNYKEIPLTPEGDLNYQAIREIVTSKTRMVMLQRSRGYSWRPSLNVSQIKQAFSVVKEVSPNCICFVDNCYGEFVELEEPTEVGADLMAGSLIKNPGGTLAPSGGYLVGDKGLIDLCAESLTAPSLGGKVGPTFGLTRTLMQGFFMAPHVVSQALAGAILVSQVFADLGFEVSPRPNEPRTDIIQAIRFDDRQKLLAFCRGIQKASPVDAQFMPVPDAMPGYEDQVIMAGGTFVQGSSLELSADAPIREPYVGFVQGGISREHVEIALNYTLLELKAVNQDFA